MSNSKKSKEETKKVKQSNSVFKTILRETRKEHNGLSFQLFMFAMISILSLLLAYIFPLSLILTLPLLVIPSYFALTSFDCAKHIHPNDKVSYFRLFKTYFHVLFFGGYRLLIGFLKALAGYVVGSAVMLTIFEVTTFSKIDEFNQIVEKISTTNDMNALYEEYMTLFTTNPIITKLMYLASSVGLVVAGIIFIQHVGKHSIKMRRNLFLNGPIPMRSFSPIDRRVRRENRKDIFAIYFSGAWFIQLLIVLAGAGGILIGYFFLKEFDFINAGIIAYFLMILVALPFMNYISKMQDIIYLSLKTQYEETFVNFTLDALEKIKNSSKIDPKVEEELKQVLDEYKKEVEETKKRLEEEKKKTHDK